MPVERPLYTVQVKRDVERAIRRLPADLRRRIEQALDRLATEPRHHGVAAMQGFVNVYRVRVGDWRVIYQIRDDVLIVLVLEVGPRGSVYRQF